MQSATPGGCSCLPGASNPPRETSIVSANSIFWAKGEVQRRCTGSAGNHEGYSTARGRHGQKYRLSVANPTQDLVLGQNSWIFALKLDLPNASFAPNPGTAGVFDNE